MRIYIDESSIFKAEKKPHSVSCVAALIVPNIIEAELFSAFEQWKLWILAHDSHKNGDEIKGSQLNENQISALLLLLSKFDVVVDTVCIDLGTTSDFEVTEYKKEIAESFSRSKIGQKLNVQFDCDVLRSLSNPNFLQSLVLHQLINRILGTSISYYAQRFPQTLSTFNWIFDAKNITVTKYEELLTFTVMPFVQAL